MNTCYATYHIQYTPSQNSYQSCASNSTTKLRQLDTEHQALAPVSQQPLTMFIDRLTQAM